MDTTTLYSLVIILIAVVLIIGLIIYLSNKKRTYSDSEESYVQKQQENFLEKEKLRDSQKPHLHLMEEQLTIDGMAKQLTFTIDCSIPSWEANKHERVEWLEIRKESNRHLTLIFTSNFGDSPREAAIEITAPIANGESLQANIQICQLEMGKFTSIEVSDSLYVFNGDAENTVTPKIQLGDANQRWLVKGIYTTDGGSWCQVKPAVNSQVKGSGNLQITTSPKSANIQSRSAIVTIECGTYPFNSVKHITLMQGVTFSYYIEYPAFDSCSRNYGVIETPLDYQTGDSIKEYTVFIHSNLRWRLIKEETNWVKVSEPEFVTEKHDGKFKVTVLPNDTSTRVYNFCAARHTIISIVTETGLVKDILIYQGGYVVIKGKYWLDRNLSGKGVVTDKAIPMGLCAHDIDTHGCHFQYGNSEETWNTSSHLPLNPWNLNTEEHPVKNTETDPSPLGWRIPSSLELQELYSRLNIPNNQFDDFSEEEQSMLIKPYRYFSLSSDSGVPVFFPLSGYRSHINGSLMDSGLQGRYWSSTEISPIYSRVLSLDRGKTAYVTHYLKKHGFSIRSILE